MMPAARYRRLLERLPPVRGRLTENAPLAGVTWFRVGGPAEVMFRPADREDLVQFIQRKPPEVPITVIGVGSNLLVRDGGIRGVVVRLGRGFAEIEPQDNRILAGAAALDLNVSLVARDTGIGGLEFLSGIPGTIGGALRMNAGAYGRDMAAVARWAEAVDEAGHVQRLSPEELGLTYRHSAVPEGWIFLGAELQGAAAGAAEIARRMNEIQAAREDTQPIRTRTGGSTFANPAGPEAAGRKAWELIEAAGCRGLKRGGAMVSEKHCNFLINTGAATAADIEALGEEVRRRVQEATGVVLEWEIRRIGDFAPSHPHGARP
jgi:UDP-N-acetylmuramate dehydrogenase